MVYAGLSSCMASDPEHILCDCDSCNRIAVAEARVTEAQKLVLDLRTARNAAHDRLVGRLPLEIVSRVFKEYVDMHFRGKISPFLYCRMEDAPLRLGAVCHTWRAIAWSSPRLWTRMSVNIFPKGRNLIPDLAMQWLKRSGQLPLSISLFELDKEEGEDEEDTEALTANIISLIRAVCKFSSRWETLDLLLTEGSVSDEVILQHWKPANDGRGSCLRNIRLRYMSPVCVANLFSNIRSRPSPTYVTLRHIDTDRLGIDWSNVTTFDVGSYTNLQHYAGVFQMAHRLRHLTLMSDFIRTDFLHTPIIIPALHSLKLEVEEDLWFPAILNALTLPSLKELEYCCSQPPSKAIGNLVSFIERSQCQLELLQIWDFRTDAEIAHLLRAMTSLKCLLITDCDQYDALSLFECLSKRTLDGLQYLPYLQQLEIGVNLDHPFPWTTLPDIFNPDQSSAELRGLQRRSLKLQVFFRRLGRWDYTCYIDTESLRRITSLTEQGFEISIGHVMFEDLIASSLARYGLNEHGAEV